MYVLRTLVFVTMMVYSGVLAFQYQKCPTGWKEQGCKIGYHHNLTILQDDRDPNAVVKINWDDQNGYVHDLSCRCRAKASSDGYKWFALNKQGICLSAKGELSDYLRVHPLDDYPTRCTGKLSITSSNAPDGSLCVLGVYRAYFYTIEQVQSSPVHAPETPAEEEVASNPDKPKEEEIAAPPKESCKSAADVILIMDISGSVGKDTGFKVEKKFALEFLSRFNLEKSRVGIITYDSEVQSVLTWEQSEKMSVEDHKNYVRNLKYSGGSTRTQLALVAARTRIIEKSPNRQNVKRTVITMTDGVSFRGLDEIGKPANILKNVYRCKMIAIGIGDSEVDELMLIAGNIKKNVIVKKNFDALGKDMVSVVNELVEKSCI